MDRWRAEHALAREAWSRMVCPDQKGNALAGDILLQACLPDVLLSLCLPWYWMGSRNHLAPYLEPRQCAVFIMAPLNLSLFVGDQSDQNT